MKLPWSGEALKREGSPLLLQDLQFTRPTTIRGFPEGWIAGGGSLIGHLIRGIDGGLRVGGNGTVGGWLIGGSTYGGSWEKGGCSMIGGMWSMGGSMIGGAKSTGGSS